MPLLAIVSVDVAVVPTVRLPNVMLPVSVIAEVGVGAVGDLSLLQPVATSSVTSASDKDSVRIGLASAMSYQPHFLIHTGIRDGRLRMRFLIRRRAKTSIDYSQEFR